MPDPLSIFGAVGVSMQIIQVGYDLMSKFKDVPDDLRKLINELQILVKFLNKINENILLNPDFSPSSNIQLEIDDLGLDGLKKELEGLLQVMISHTQGSRFGWERIKATIDGKKMVETVGGIHRRCQAINSMVTIVIAAMTAKIQKNLDTVRTEQQSTADVTKIIHGHLRDTKSEQEAREADKRRKEILNWLTDVDFDVVQNDFIRRREPQTGQWLFKTPEFDAWLNTKGRTLFCPGIPGVGKTILTAIVSEDLVKRFSKDQDIGVAYIFHRYKVDYKLDDLVSSLVKQFCQKKTTLPTAVTDLFEQYEGRSTRPSTDEMTKVLSTVVSTFSKFYIIVDALDECNKDTCRQSFLDMGFYLQETHGANLFVTSRGIHGIVECFARPTSTSVEIRADDNDIRKYLQSRIAESGTKAINSNSDLITGQIVTAADGIFLLANLYFEAVRSKPTLKKIKDLLNGLSAGARAYDRAYDQAMERISGQDPDSKELAHTALSWIIYAKRQLTAVELQHALAVEPDTSELDEENIPEIEDVLAVCAGLVVLDGESGVIRLVHFTAQEYFERTKDKHFPDSESEVLKTCLTYLMFKDIGLASQIIDYFDRIKRQPLYSYVAPNWGYHANKLAVLPPGVMEFLRSGEKLGASVQAMKYETAQWDSLIGDTLFGFGPLHVAAYFGIVPAINQLVREGADVNALDDRTKRTPLSWAAEKGTESAVKILLDNGADPELRDDRRQSPLEIAVSKDQLSIIKVLLEKDGYQENNCIIAFRQAVIYARERIITFLMEKGVIVDSQANMMRWLGYSLVIGQQTDRVIKLLLKHGININAKFDEDNTLLHLTAAANSARVVNALVENGADLDAKNSSGDTPLDRAVALLNHATIRLLLDKSLSLAISQANATKLLPAAVALDDATAFKLLVDKGADIHARNRHGLTLLHLAAGDFASLTVLKLLLASGVEVDVKSKRDGITPLYWVLNKVKKVRLAHQETWETRERCEKYESDSMVVIRLLLEAGADPYAKDSTGRTMISIAKGKGHKKLNELFDEFETGSKPDEY